uniref:EF-hand domain-containing protein n=1 Tax=Panagrolaimus sp. JU765 TaxID=591449 RepID=A0AC34QFD7_9BILA
MNVPLLVIFLSIFFVTSLGNVTTTTVKSVGTSTVGTVKINATAASATLGNGTVAAILSTMKPIVSNASAQANATIQALASTIKAAVGNVTLPPTLKPTNVSAVIEHLASTIKAAVGNVTLPPVIKPTNVSAMVEHLASTIKAAVSNVTLPMIMTMPTMKPVNVSVVVEHLASTVKTLGAELHNTTVATAIKDAAANISSTLKPIAANVSAAAASVASTVKAALANTTLPPHPANGSIMVEAVNAAAGAATTHKPVNSSSTVAALGTTKTSTTIHASTALYLITATAASTTANATKASTVVASSSNSTSNATTDCQGKNLTTILSWWRYCGPSDASLANFNKMDANNDSVVNSTEYYNYCFKPVEQGLYCHFDTNGDGNITFSEFIPKFTAYMIPSQNLSGFDANNDGKMDAKELTTYLNSRKINPTNLTKYLGNNSSATLNMDGFALFASSIPNATFPCLNVTENGFGFPNRCNPNYSNPWQMYNAMLTTGNTVVTNSDKTKGYYYAMGQLWQHKFDFIDRDRDGNISNFEWQRYVSPRNFSQTAIDKTKGYYYAMGQLWQHKFDFIDRDRDGNISNFEWQRYVSPRNFSQTAIGKYDLNKDGKLNKAEMKSLLKDLNMERKNLWKLTFGHKNLTVSDVENLVQNLPNEQFRQFIQGNISRFDTFGRLVHAPFRMDTNNTKKS